MSVRVIETPGILRMVAIDHEHQRTDGISRLACQPQRADKLAIHHRHLLARAQVGERLFPLVRRNLERDAMASAAAIETEHQTRPFGRPAIHVRVEAQAAVKTVEDGLLARDERETWIPHQRAVAKYPKVVHRRGHIEAIAEEPESANGAKKIAAMANVRAARRRASSRRLMDDLLVGRVLQNSRKPMRRRNSGLRRAAYR